MTKLNQYGIKLSFQVISSDFGNLVSRSQGSPFSKGLLHHGRLSLTQNVDRAAEYSSEDFRYNLCRQEQHATDFMYALEG